MEAQTKDRSLPRQTAMICKGIHRRLCAARLVDVVSKQTSTRYFLPGSLTVSRFALAPQHRALSRFHARFAGCPPDRWTATSESRVFVTAIPSRLCRALHPVAGSPVQQTRTAPGPFAESPGPEAISSLIFAAFGVKAAGTFVSLAGAANRWTAVAELFALMRVSIGWSHDAALLRKDGAGALRRESRHDSNQWTRA